MQEPAVAYLTLSNSELVAIVDKSIEEDLLAIGDWKLHSYGYVEMARMIKDVHCYLHNFLADIYGWDRSVLTVDHKNQNKLDCRRSNLRLATRRQNNMNRGHQRSNVSGFIGVSLDTRRNKWRAQTSINGKNMFLGYFTDKIEAARAYDAALREGPDADYGVYNFPLTGEAA